MNPAGAAAGDSEGWFPAVTQVVGGEGVTSLQPRTAIAKGGQKQGVDKDRGQEKHPEGLLPGLVTQGALCEKRTRPPPHQGEQVQRPFRHPLPTGSRRVLVPGVGRECGKARGEVASGQGSGGMTGKGESRAEGGRDQGSR